MKSKEPFVEALEEYGKAKVYPLHTPGHKGGRGIPASLGKLLGSSALRLDVSLMEELDDIHHPSTCLKEAETLAAELYGADRSFFAVNGTTGAIHGMLLGALKPGDKILVPRNAHKSVFGGLVLAGLNPIYIVPTYSKEYAMSLQVTPLQVEEALEAHKDIKAVFLTTPNYFGIAADVASIAEIAHSHGAVLLVDEAHGPHLGFSPLLPASALSLGADALSQSTHKIVGAMTQCSLLHMKKTYLSEDAFERAMSLVTTTSPNMLFLASLDAARAQLAEQGTQMAENAVLAANILKEKLRKVQGIKVLERDILGLSGAFDLDATKVTIKVTGLGLTGVEVGDLLRKAGIAVELVDEANVLFLVTYADHNSEFLDIVDRIVQVLETNRKYSVLGKKEKNKEEEQLSFVSPVPKVRLTPRDAFFGDKQMVDFKESCGRISGEQISFYPPGIPVLLPGEEITKEIIEYCLKLHSLGLNVSGPKDCTLEKIQVMVNA